VLSVRRIYAYYKKHGIETVVMGASFRNAGEIEALAGCDRLTISPALLDELAGAQGELPRKLSPQTTARCAGRMTLDEKGFRFALNEDAMATESSPRDPAVREGSALAAGAGGEATRGSKAA
jgi:transaldolase